MSRASAFPVILPAGFSLIFGLAGIGSLPESRVDPSEMPVSCFVVAGKVACIDAGFVPALPGASGTIVVGPSIEGDDVDQTIRDDGGREVAVG